MSQRCKWLQRLLCLLCALVMLPLADLTSLRAWAEPGVADGLSVLQDVIVTQTAVITKDTLVAGDVTFSQGAEIVVDNATLSVQPGAVLRANVTLKGKEAKLNMGGTLMGDVLVQGENAMADIGGRVQGTVTVRNDGERVLGRMHDTVRLHEGSHAETLVLDGSGFATIFGSVGLLDTTAANKASFELGFGHADTIYLRSDANAYVNNGATIDLLVLEAEECTFEKQGYSANIALNGDAYAKTVQVLSGFVDIDNGAHVDTLYLTGRRAMAHLEVFNDVSKPTPSIDEVYVYGRDANMMARGEIGYCYVENGLLQNHGHIETLVMNGGLLWSETGGVVSEHDYPYIADRFPLMYDEFIMLRGNAELRNSVAIDRSVVLGGSISPDSTTHVKPLLNGKIMHFSKGKTLTPGVISAKRGDVYTISTDAFAALSVAASSTEDGGVLIAQPGDRYAWLDTANGTDSITMMAQEAGEYTLTVMSDAELTVAIEPPVAVGVALTSRTSVAKGEKAVVEPVSLSSVEMILTNETTGKRIDFVRNGDTLYALPEAAQPGHVVSVRVDGAEPAILTLDDQRAASAEMEIVEAGRYEGTPKDDARAHLYLYDANGSFLQEVFYRSGMYATGAMESGSYQAVWVRGGVNGWKLPHMADFAANGLKEGEHYLCEAITIENGVVLRSTPDIPAEPTLQSPWLDADKTAYRAMSQTVVQGDMVLMSLEYALTDVNAASVEAKIDFLGCAQYVDGSASINGKLTAAKWNGNSLTVPLNGKEGKLLFYMRSDEEALSITSSASIVFDGTAQYVGSAQTAVAPLSITAPSLTSESTVFVYGYALPYSVVAVCDNGRVDSYAMANGAGMWNSRVELTSEASHVLTVRSEDGEAESESVVVLRASGTPVLKQFTVEYMEHGLARRIDISGERFGSDIIRVAYEPGTDLAFTLTFANDELVESIHLIAEQNGYREKLPLTKTADGVWTSVTYMSKDKAFTPDLFTIEYNFRTDALDQVFAQTYADVPLMDILYMANDIEDDLPLSRYYMADPAYHGVDIGFGKGWLTDYTILSKIETDKDGVQTAIVFSPTGTRMFSGVGGKLTEMGGYAKATVKKDALTVTEPDGGTMQFDAEGRLLKVTDAYTNAMDLVYHEEGYLLSVKTADAELTFTYGEDGHILSTQCGDAVTEYTYSDGYLLYATTEENTSIYTYNGLHTQSGTLRLNGVNDESGVMQFSYDSQGRVVMLSAGQDSVRIDYGEDEMTLTMGDHSATYQLDASGALLGGTASDGSSMKLERTTDGARLIVTDARGLSTEIATNDKGDVLSERDANGNTVRYTYDDAGNQTSIIDQLGNVTKYQYDQKGELTKITYADGSAESWKYDKQGNTTSYTDRAGNATTYTYGKEGFLTRVNNPDGTKLEVDTHENDEGSYYSEMHLGEEWASIYTNDDHAGYTFDGFDVYEGIEYPALSANDVGTNSNYDRDTLRSITSVQGRRLVEFVYDKQERLTMEKLGNGAYTTYAYAENGALARRENHALDRSVLSFDAFEYDEYGNIIRHETEDGVWEYGYDNIGQLTRIFAPDGTETLYVYDAAGNRVSKRVNGVTTQYTVNALNQYTQVGDTAYSYDKNGNLIREEGPSGVKEYKWNQLNQLVEVNDGQTVTQYTYDLFGNRSSMTQNGQTTTYHTAPTELSMMLRQEDALGQTNYLYGDTGLVGAEWNGQQVYYTFNYLGSIKEIMDAHGHVLCSYDYDYEGNVVGEWVYTAEDAMDPAQQQRAEMAYAMSQQQLRYVGKYGIMDDGNGLHYVRARYLHDADSRFMSPDPAGQVYDINVYRYAYDNPIRFIDITGKDGFDISNGGDSFNQRPKPFDHPKPTDIIRRPEIPGDESIFKDYGYNKRQEYQDLKNAEKAYLDAEDLLKPKKTTPFRWWKFIKWGGRIIAIIGSVWFTVVAVFAEGNPTAPPELDELPPEKRGGYRPPYPGPSSPGDISVDPSGYVFEAVPSNRVEGVTATVYYRAEDGTAILWDASEFSQINPQLTDFLGQYAWYVPTGEWRVVYEKDGYETTQTGWLPVPPPQTEVNVEIVSRKAPQVTHTALFGDGIEVTFSKYMDIASVQQAVRLNAADGRELMAEAQPLNAEQMASEDRVVASRFLIQAEGLADGAMLTIGQNALSYAGTPVQPYAGSPKRAYRLESLGLEKEYTLQTDYTTIIDLNAVGEGGYNTMSLVVEMAGGSCVTGGSISALDANGAGALVIHTGSAGRATLRIREKNSGYEEVIQLVASPEPDCLYKAEVITKGSEGVDLWQTTAGKQSNGRAAKSEIVYVIEDAGKGWVKIRYNGIEGLTQAKYLKEIQN
ncbi:MAG: hypothetical protein PUD16_10295 [bacterium]|nr:hypothetical protein [bacterium]